MRILISHAVEDEGAAALLKSLIERCSFKKIEVWFSSDRSGGGGVPLGVAWFADIVQRLNTVDVIAALVTPQSIKSPWLYFECGFLAHKGNNSIIPLLLGASMSELPMPLSLYQAHDLASPVALLSFLEKLFQTGNIELDEELTRTFRNETAQRLIEFASASASQSPPTNEQQNFEALRQYLDKRFLELTQQLIVSPSESQSSPNPPSFDISFKALDLDGDLITAFKLSVTSDTTMQSILDECYFRLDRRVKPYHYLVQWIITEDQTGRKLLTEGRGSDTFAATRFFDPSRTYTVSLLERPYNPLNDIFGED